MAGAIVARETENSLMAMTKEQSHHWQWKVQFARCFTYPSSYLSKSTSITSSSSSLIPLKRKNFKPIWITSSEPSIVSLHPSANSILTVSVQGTVVEEHFISTLYFTWPQVSCLSGFPTRGSLVVLASYVDSSDETQKFAMGFSRISDVEDFIISLENILSNKIPNGCRAVDVVPAISSQSEFVPAYRPDTSSMETPICDFISPNNLHKEEKQCSLIQDTVADSQSNFDTLPPRFTSLVSSCSAELEQAELEQGTLAMPLPLSDVPLSDLPENTDLKAQISKYMQDASFLDIVNKVNEVITELGGDYLM